MEAGESTQSLWKNEPIADRPALLHDESCDVCIVGAGIAGLSAAYHLTREGKRVIVIDARGVGAGETGQTTAHLASALDDRFSELARVHGEHGARLAYESHARAIDEMQATADRESIDCHFHRLDGYLFLAPGQSEKLLDDELEMGRRIGFAGIESLPRAPALSFDTGRCLVFPRQARFHPLRYLVGLTSSVERRGGSVYFGTSAVEVSGGSEVTVRTSAGFDIRAKTAIIATNSPFHPRLALHSKQAPYRTYVVAFRIPSGSVPDALYWDTADPYHYVRLEPGRDGYDHLIVGGEDHRTAMAEDMAVRYQRLEQWTRQRFPMAERMSYRWSGQVMEPFDYLAFIGKDPGGQRNVFVATGDSGHGMTHGTIAGMLLKDLALGRENPWAELYDPSRKTVRAGREYVKDNLEVAAEYAKWLKPDLREKPETLAVGEGAIVQRGLRKIAVYRDARGELHEHSAVCTHLGCIVRWNTDAKSWDCPCHGSRFAPTGEVLNGPAMSPLRPAESSGTTHRTPFGSLLIGAAAGAVATGAMSAFLFGTKKLGLLGEPPPKKIVRFMRRRAGIFGVSRRTESIATLLAHWGYGMLTGAAFGLLHGPRRGIARSSALGAGYGTLVWAASYMGWVPALEIMPPPHRDRPFRPTSMVLAHLVFGGVLGAVADAMMPVERTDGEGHDHPSFPARAHAPDALPLTK